MLSRPEVLNPSITETPFIYIYILPCDLHIIPDITLFRDELSISCQYQHSKMYWKCVKKYVQYLLLLQYFYFFIYLVYLFKCKSSYNFF